MRETRRAVLLLAGLGALPALQGRVLAQPAESCRVELVHAFGEHADDGERPADGVSIGPDGALVGVTAGGGRHGFGRLFRLSLDGRETPLHDFAGAPADGADPEAAPTPDGEGGLYGTTLLGGAHRQGSVYHVDAAGSLRLLHSFGGAPDDGANPQAPLLHATDGNWYGTTRGGGRHGGGVLFRITRDGRYEAVAHFGDGEALSEALSDPLGALVQHDDGAILGAASQGGRHGRGGVFSYQPLDPDRRALRTLVSLGAGHDCAMPMAGLTRTRDGRLLGTAYAGGPANAGCVFALGPRGDYRVLYALRGAEDGSQPLSLPLQALDGRLYLTSSLGAAHGDGALLRLDVAGGVPEVPTAATAATAATVLHAFGRADVSVPSGRLAQAADGRIHGSAPYGGSHDLGGVFRATCWPPLPAARAVSAR